MKRITHWHTPRGNFLDQPRFRPEVQGLRSLAVLLVVMYHVWFGRVSGGVDVFLFISAFLLSLSSLGKIQAGKPLKILGYWIHVFQRLLPVAALVIAATTVASALILAPSRWNGILADAKASLLYYLNWRLAFTSVDYYAQDATTKTPFQHFWSLSMQGQIFILWPLLFALVAFLVGYLRLKVLPTALLIFGSVFVTSLTFSIIKTYSDQSFAYFDTRTRLWEFASGTLLAMLLLAWKVPQRAKVPMGWLGLLGLVTCGWILPVQQAFPGFLALWPILSAALVIAAGKTDSPLGADRFLSTWPLQKLGAISYCLYLVHWPLLILYTSKVGKAHAGFLDGTLLILASIALAWGLHQLVEKPLRALDRKPSAKALKASAAAPGGRHRKEVTSPAWVRPLALIAISLTLVGGPISAAQAWASYQHQRLLALAETSGSDDFPGARALTSSFSDYEHDPIPAIEPLSQYDGAQVPCAGDFLPQNLGLESFCTYEQYGQADSPRIMVVGASHAGQSLAMLRPLAEQTGSNLIDMHLGGCRYPQEPKPNEECSYLNSQITQEILESKPDTLVLLATLTDPASNQEVIMPGIEEKIAAFTQAGIQVIALRDNPRYTYNVYECAQTNLKNLAACQAKAADKLAPLNPAAALAARNPLVYTADLTAAYCPEGICQPVIGNVYVYMDDNHIGRAYGKTLAPLLADQLQDQGWGPRGPGSSWEIS